MTERGLKNINVFYSTFYKRFFVTFFLRFLTFFYFFLELFLHLCQKVLRPDGNIGADGIFFGVKRLLLLTYYDIITTFISRRECPVLTFCLWFILLNVASGISLRIYDWRFAWEIYVGIVQCNMSQWVTLSFAETKVWDLGLRPKKPVWDLINAKSKVTLSFGLRLESQTKLRAETK